MRIKGFLPQKRAGHRVQGIDLGPQISKVNHVAGSGAIDTDGRAHARISLKAPMRASGGCVQGKDLAGGTTYKDPPSCYHRLRVGREGGREPKSPLQLEFWDLLRGELRGSSGLKSAVLQIHTPAVPHGPIKTPGWPGHAAVGLGGRELSWLFSGEELRHRPFLFQAKSRPLAAHGPLIQRVQDSFRANGLQNIPVHVRRGKRQLVTRRTMCLIKLLAVVSLLSTKGGRKCQAGDESRAERQGRVPKPALPKSSRFYQ